jgi:hypothetical protein
LAMHPVLECSAAMRDRQARRRTVSARQMRRFRAPSGNDTGAGTAGDPCRNRL